MKLSVRQGKFQQDYTQHELYQANDHYTRGSLLIEASPPVEEVFPPSLLPHHFPPHPPLESYTSVNFSNICEANCPPPLALDEGLTSNIKEKQHHLPVAHAHTDATAELVKGTKSKADDDHALPPPSSPLLNKRRVSFRLTECPPSSSSQKARESNAPPLPIPPPGAIKYPPPGSGGGGGGGEAFYSRTHPRPPHPASSNKATEGLPNMRRVSSGSEVIPPPSPPHPPAYTHDKYVEDDPTSDLKHSVFNPSPPSVPPGGGGYPPKASIWAGRNRGVYSVFKRVGKLFRAAVQYPLPKYAGSYRSSEEKRAAHHHHHHHPPGGLGNASLIGGEKMRGERGGRSWVFSSSLTESLFFSRFREFFAILATRLYYSTFTAYIYLFVLLINFYILVKGFILGDVTTTLVILECFVTFMLVFELLLRVLIQGWSLFRQPDGIFDSFVAITCCTLLLTSGDLWRVSSVESSDISHEADEMLEQSLTALRFAVQLMRIVSFALRHQRGQLPREQIDFSILQVTSRTDDL